MSRGVTQATELQPYLQNLLHHLLCAWLTTNACHSGQLQLLTKPPIDVLVGSKAQSVYCLPSISPHISIMKFVENCQPHNFIQYDCAGQFRTSALPLPQKEKKISYQTDNLVICVDKKFDQLVLGLCQRSPLPISAKCMVAVSPLIQNKLPNITI